MSYQKSEVSRLIELWHGLQKTVIDEHVDEGANVCDFAFVP